MSNTPRTDAAAFVAGTYSTNGGTTAFQVVRAGIAQELERELAAVTAERDAEIARLREDLQSARGLLKHETHESSVLRGALKVANTERDAALTKIREHNSAMDAECAARTTGKDNEPCRSVWQQYKHDGCPDCPREHRIEVDP